MLLPGLDRLQSYRQTLSILSRTCRACHSTFVPLLFRDVVLTEAHFASFLAALQRRPELGGLVRTIQVDWPRDAPMDQARLKAFLCAWGPKRNVREETLFRLIQRDRIAIAQLAHTSLSFVVVLCIHRLLTGLTQLEYDPRLIVLACWPLAQRIDGADIGSLVFRDVDAGVGLPETISGLTTDINIADIFRPNRTPRAVHHLHMASCARAHLLLPSLFAPLRDSLGVSVKVLDLPSSLCASEQDIIGFLHHLNALTELKIHLCVPGSDKDTTPVEVIPLLHRCASLQGVLQKLSVRASQDYQILAKGGIDAVTLFNTLAGVSCLLHLCVSIADHAAPADVDSVVRLPADLMHLHIAIGMTLRAAAGAMAHPVEETPDTYLDALSNILEKGRLPSRLSSIIVTIAHGGIEKRQKAVIDAALQRLRTAGASQGFSTECSLAWEVLTHKMLRSAP